MLRRLTTGALLAALLLPAGAAAGWSSAERLPGGTPAPAPRPAVEVVDTRPRPPGPVAVRFRDGSEQQLPGTEHMARPEGVATGGGVVAAVWSVVVAGCGESGGYSDKPSYCDKEAWATVWRRGETPPAPRRVSRAGRHVFAPVVGVGTDGTVLVAWDVQSDGFDQDQLRVEAAISRGGGRLVRSSRVAAPRGAFLDGNAIQVVRGRPQLSWFTDRDRGVTDVRAGRLGRWRREARLPGGVGEAATLLRSARGDRLLWWEEDGAVFFRRGAPSRRLSRVVRRRGEPKSVVMGPRGDFAVALRLTRDARSRLQILRGRTTSGRILADRLGAMTSPLTDHGVTTVSLGVDIAGRTYAAWSFPVRRLGQGSERSGVAVASAPRGRRLGSGEVISDRPASCSGPALAVFGRGRAVAQWVCQGSPFFAERSRYRR